VAPTITTQPGNQTVTAGQTAAFTVVAMGTAPLSYQWQKNGANIAGATAASYTAPVTTTADSGANFDVVVSNTAGTVTSAAATLTVNPAPVAPTITAQPGNQTVTAGQTAAFTAVAAGTAPLSYQWQKNGANIPGATSTSYTTPVTTTADSGASFAVVVSNTAGTVTSAAATLTVNPAPVAPTITTQPANQTVTAGQTATFTVVAAGTAPLSYQWQKSGVNIAGATLASYTTPATTTTDSGATFRVVVTNTAGTVISNTATLTVNPAPAPAIQVSPTSINFGNVVVGTTSSQALIIKNSGTATLTISQVTATGSVFSVSGFSLPLNVSAGQQTTITVAFLPTVVGSASDNISIVSNAPTSPTSVGLSGTGVAATFTLGISPTSLSFGSVATDTSSAAQTVTITNTGNSNVTISSATVSGAEFSASGVNAGTTLTPSQTATLSVMFTPTMAGSANGSISVFSNATNSPATVSLSGTGVVQSAPDPTPPICGLTNDISNHIPDATDWRTFTPPPKGGTYVDALYGCTVKRLTDGVTDGRAYVHYYATVEPMSAGDTKIIVGRNDMIIDLNGNVVVSGANMPSSNNDQSLNLWDRTNDMVFWSTQGNTLQECVVSNNSPGATVSCSANHTFSEYSGYMVNIMDETDMTPNGWIPMIGQNTQGGFIDVFLYNPSIGTKSSVFNTSNAETNCSDDVNQVNGNCIHKLIGTPNDGILIELESCASGVYAGQPCNILWESPWPASPTEFDAPHLDTGKDLSNNPVYIAESSGGPNTCGSVDRSPALTQYQTPGWTPANYLCLFANPTGNPNWHVSYRDWPASAWTVYSAQQLSGGPQCFNNAGCYADPSSSNWPLYTNEFVMVRIDANNAASQIYRLTLTHGRGMASGSNYFWSDPRAVVSWDGNYVIFDSNAAWASNGCGSVGFCSDIYLIQLH